VEPIENEKRVKYRYWIAYLPGNRDEGSTFKPGALHLTIIPWFVVDIGDEEVLDSFHRKFAAKKSFDLVVGKQTVFHFKRKLAVNLFEPSPKIMQLHVEALELFDELNARWAVKTPNVGQDFIPHVRGFSQGDKLHIDELSLVRAIRREDGIREVAAKAEFNEKT
jgi:2'-5' RNA ligase